MTSHQQQSNLGFIAAPMTMRDLFRVSNQRTYYFTIPIFQRAYEWDKKQRQELLEDIVNSEANSYGHFIGSIFVTGGGNKKEVIDGQQRLTTFSLIVLAMTKYVNEMGWKLDLSDNLSPEKIIYTDDSDFSDSDAKFNQNDKYIALRIIPSDQKDNKIEYCGIVENIYDLNFHASFLAKNTPAGRRIRIAYTHIYNWFKQNLTSINAVNKFYEQLLNLRIVFISANDDVQAMDLFNGLNNKGLSLTASDVVKNTVLRSLKINAKSSTMDQIVQIWNDFTNEIDQKYHALFLKQFLYILYYNHNFTFTKLKGINSPIKDKQLSVCYEDLLNANKDKNDLFVSKLSETKNMYVTLLNPKPMYNEVSDKFTRQLVELNMIQATPAYSLILFLQLKNINGAILIQVIELLCKIFLRQHLTDYPRISAIDNSIIQTMTDLKTTDARNITFSSIKDLLIKNNSNIHSSNDVLSAKLKDSMYNEDAPITRYLLIKLSALLDSNHADKHDDIHYWFFEFSKMSRNSAGKKQLIYTIEHILPQNLTPQWKTMLKGDDDLLDSAIEKIQSECLHIIGNLTITANNGTLRDLPFQQKQKASKGSYKVYDDNGHLSNDTEYKVGYEDNTPLNNMLFDFDETSASLENIHIWNKKSITNRTETMVTILTKYLSLE